MYFREEIFATEGEYFFVKMCVWFAIFSAYFWLIN